ncbi:MAG: LUD domain-containing protein [Thermoguttaceae bacterium]|jgi:L-lactate dehydrogenase complex protein LldG
MTIMSTSSRDAILHRIRTELSKGPPIQAPPVPEVWPRQNADSAVLADQFQSELKAVHGEVIRSATMNEAQKQLAELVKGAGWTSIGVMYRPICSDVVIGLDPKSIQWPKPNWAPDEMAELSASIVAADILLADTGSSLIACPTAEDRLLCYLPPECVIIARVDQLSEHLPAAWPIVARRVAERDLSGEFVIVTGPSRTSDIEKTLILGVHGPKHLVVLLVG